MLIKTKQQYNEQEMFVWDIWEQNLLTGEAPDLPERSQPLEQQQREGIDKLFLIGTTGQTETV